MYHTFSTQYIPDYLKITLEVINWLDTMQSLSRYTRNVEKIKDQQTNKTGSIFSNIHRENLWWVQAN